jgi:hypothetical protein
MLKYELRELARVVQMSENWNKKIAQLGIGAKNHCILMLISANTRFRSFWFLSFINLRRVEWCFSRLELKTKKKAVSPRFDYFRVFQSLDEAFFEAC